MQSGWRDGTTSEVDETAAALIDAMREASAIGILYTATVARRLGMNASDFECLNIVARNEPVTAGGIASEIRLTTGAVTGMLDRLEKLELVTRTRSTTDRRVVLISTTTKFRAKVLPLFKPMQRAQRDLIDRCNPTQVRHAHAFLTSAIEAAREALDELGTK